eukprot:TRINITY_DN15366_c1_g4_i1.p1 TRINITY_DN15366_c1_g4~~TRINITY_DN15366_c1_g4_i1.p1  ORF type:complete len:545 (-),score=73.28 TRINITY_DN15366_c1_g4_i1:192-1826(-)
MAHEVIELINDMVNNLLQQKTKLQFLVANHACLSDAGFLVDAALPSTLANGFYATTPSASFDVGTLIEHAAASALSHRDDSLAANASCETHCVHEAVQEDSDDSWGEWDKDGKVGCGLVDSPGPAHTMTAYAKDDGDDDHHDDDTRSAWSNTVVEVPQSQVSVAAGVKNSATKTPQQPASHSQSKSKGASLPQLSKADEKNVLRSVVRYVESALRAAPGGRLVAGNVCNALWKEIPESKPLIKKLKMSGLCEKSGGMFSHSENVLQLRKKAQADENKTKSDENRIPWSMIAPKPKSEPRKKASAASDASPRELPELTSDAVAKLARPGAVKRQLPVGEMTLDSDEECRRRKRAARFGHVVRSCSDAAESCLTTTSQALRNSLYSEGERRGECLKSPRSGNERRGEYLPAPAQDAELPLSLSIESQGNSGDTSAAAASILTQSAVSTQAEFLQARLRHLKEQVSQGTRPRSPEVSPAHEALSGASSSSSSSSSSPRRSSPAKSDTSSHSNDRAMSCSSSRRVRGSALSESATKASVEELEGVITL